MKLCVKVLRPTSERSRVARVEPCHWSEGCWGVTAGKASHNASNAMGVTVGTMGCNSSEYNGVNLQLRNIFFQE